MLLELLVYSPLFLNSMFGRPTACIVTDMAFLSLKSNLLVYPRAWVSLLALVFVVQLSSVASIPPISTSSVMSLSSICTIGPVLAVFVLVVISLFDLGIKC